jgi:hypothetical protein
LAYTAQYDTETHTIQASLPDGGYTLLVSAATDGRSDPGPERTAGRGFQKPVPLTGFAEFSVNGHAVANLRIPLSPAPAWQIHLRALRTAPQPARSGIDASRGLQANITITATGVEAPPDGGGTEVMAEDTGPDQLELTTSGQGPVWLSAQVNDRSLCLESFTAGGANLARETLIAGFIGAPPPLELTLRDDCAKLNIELPQALSAFLPGDEPFYTVYVVPDFDTTTDLPPMTIHPSSGASIRMEGLTPGNYHVYLFCTPIRLEYRNPSALAALPRPGQAVTLSPGAVSNLVLEAPAE